MDDHYWQLLVRNQALGERGFRDHILDHGNILHFYACTLRHDCRPMDKFRKTIRNTAYPVRDNIYFASGRRRPSDVFLGDTAGNDILHAFPCPVVFDSVQFAQQSQPRHGETLSSDTRMGDGGLHRRHVAYKPDREQSLGKPILHSGRFGHITRFVRVFPAGSASAEHSRQRQDACTDTRTGSIQTVQGP